VGFAPTGKRRLVTAHTQGGRLRSDLVLRIEMLRATSSRVRDQNKWNSMLAIYNRAMGSFTTAAAPRL
jgi:hypothetical protein